MNYSNGFYDEHDITYIYKEYNHFPVGCIGFMVVPKSFQQKLNDILKRKNMTDPELYNKIEMDRQHYNKIINHQLKTISKKDALKICIGLELSLNDSKDLLEHLGFCFNPHDIREVVIKDCIEKGIYDTYRVDEILYKEANETIFSEK